MNPKTARLGHAMLCFVEGFRHGVRSQRDSATKQDLPARPSPTTNGAHAHGYQSWSSAYELVNRLESEAERLEIDPDQLREYFAQGTIRESEWQALEPELTREHDGHEFLERKRKIQAAIRGKLVSNFIEQHASTRFNWEKHSLKRRIEMLLWESRREALQSYLTDVLEVGTEGADKNQKREQRKGGAALYTWAVIVGTIKLGIVLGAFSVSKTRFETVVVALIVLTYQMIESHSSDWNVHALLNNWEFRVASRRIRRLLKEEVPEEVAERELEEEQAFEKASYRSSIGTLIQAIFGLIIFAIALFELVFEGVI